MRFLQLRYWSPLNIVRFCKRTTTTKGWIRNYVAKRYTYTCICMCCFFALSVGSFVSFSFWMNTRRTWLTDTEGIIRWKRAAKTYRKARERWTTKLLGVYIARRVDRTKCQRVWRKNESQTQTKSTQQLLFTTSTNYDEMKFNSEIHWMAVHTKQSVVD